MGLLDRFPQGRPGVVLLIATGVIAALLGSAAAVLAWGGQDQEDDAPQSGPTRSGDPTVRVVSRAGGFAVEAPGSLLGDQVGRGVKFTTEAGDLVITIAPTGTNGLPDGHASALDAIDRTYSTMRVDGEVRTTMGGLTAQRTVGVVERRRGDQLIFSATTAAQGRRAWSVVMFAARDIDPARLQRYYQPVLDGFRPLR